MTSRRRVGMMIVMPAFAEGQNRDQEIIRRIVAGVVALGAPKMRGRIDQPGGVKSDRHPQEYSPQDRLPTKGEQDPYAERGEGNPVPLAEPYVVLVFTKIRNVGGELRGGLMHRLSGQNPTHVRPPLAVARGMRVALLIRELMVNAVGSNPEDRPAFKRKRSASGKEIFHPLGSLISAMGQQAMVAHSDSEAAGNPPEKRSKNQILPTEEEQSGDSSDVEHRHKERCDPIDSITIFGLEYQGVPSLREK